MTHTASRANSLFAVGPVSSLYVAGTAECTMLRCGSLCECLFLLLQGAGSTKGPCAEKGSVQCLPRGSDVVLFWWESYSLPRDYDALFQKGATFEPLGSCQDHMPESKLNLNGWGSKANPTKYDTKTAGRRLTERSRLLSQHHGNI